MADRVSAKEFFDSFRDLRMVLAPVAKLGMKPSPAQMRCLMEEFEAAMKNERSVEVLSKIENKETLIWIMQLIWRDHINHLNALMVVPEGPYLDADEFFQSYKEKHGAILAPVDTRELSLEEMDVAQQLFDEVMGSPKVVNELRRAKKPDDAIEVMHRAWKGELLKRKVMGDHCDGLLY